MTSKDKITTMGFLLAGMMNMSALVFSKFFTNPIVNQTDPVVMSNFGLLMIVVWGLAYISVANNYSKVKWLVGVFALEKFIYAIVWTIWIMNNSVADVFEKDTLAGLFYSIYGINDYIFGFFFLLVFIRLLKAEAKPI